MGTLLDLPTLRGLAPGQLQMKVNAALGFLCAAVSLFLLTWPTTPLRRRVGRGLAVFITLLGGLTLLEYLFSADFGIDQLIFRDRSNGPGYIPGRMVPATALNFVFKGVSLLMLDWETARGRRPAQILSLVSALAPLQVLIAYSHGKDAILDVGQYPMLTQMSPQTALAWISISIGTLVARPQVGFMRPFFAENFSARALRRIAAAAIVLPLLLAWLTATGGRVEFYHRGFGSSLFGLLVVCFLIYVVWRSGRDIAEYEDRIARKRSELERSNRVRDEFLSIASHELRTPLTSLKLQSQIRARSLETGNMDAFSGESLKRMVMGDNRQIDRLIRLVDDMLDVGRINTGRFSMQPGRFDLAVLAREVTERLAPQFQIAEQSLVLEAKEPVEGEWDRYRLDQVLTNLLTNALKYGEGKPVTVRVERVGEKAVLSVQDRGIGIAPEDQMRIFGRFERVTHVAQVGGLGLGLYIARQIVQAHGGQLRVDSQSGEGSRFTVELPLHPPRVE